MRRPWAGLLAAGLALGPACGGGGSGSSSGTTREGEKSGHTFTVGVDGRTEGSSASWQHFFPEDLVAGPGDTIEFRSTFTGEPHTVAFGTLVQEYLAASATADASPGRPPPADVQAALAKVPLMVRDGAGPDDHFVQAAAQPCYLTAEDPPTTEACPADKRQPPAEIDGKERFLSSGYLGDGDVVSFTLADDMAAGQYTFMCLVHGDAMTTEVTVLDRFSVVPTPDEVVAAGRKQLEDLEAAVQADVDRVRSSTSPSAPAGGFPADESLRSAGINAFPAEIGVRAGEKVTWTVDGFHSIAFNAPEDARPWVGFDAAGTLVANKKSFTPAASPAIPEPPPGAAASGAPAPPLPVDAGTWDGQGFHSSGATFSGGRLVYSLAFSAPGTYKYLCLVHPDMEGTVQVS